MGWSMALPLRKLLGDARKREMGLERGVAIAIAMERARVRASGIQDEPPRGLKNQDGRQRCQENSTDSSREQGVSLREIGDTNHGQDQHDNLKTVYVPTQLGECELQRRPVEGRSSNLLAVGFEQARETGAKKGRGQRAGAHRHRDPVSPRDASPSDTGKR
jgi:hypothetical protein